MRERALLLVSVAALLVLAACESDPSRDAESGRLSVVHEDDSGTLLTDTRGIVIVLVSAGGTIRYSDAIRYPVPTEAVPPAKEKSRRYDLFRDLELPAGRVVLRFRVVSCLPQFCPERGDADLEQFFSDGGLPARPGEVGQPSGICELELEVPKGGSREFVVAWHALGPLGPCRIAS